MGKRANNQAAAKASKKPKIDPALAPIADVVKNATHLPERCRSMLVDLLPFSLASAADVRSESQVAVVSMMEETFMGVKSDMETDVSNKRENQQSLEASKAERTGEIDECNTAVSTQKEACDAAKAALDDATTAMNVSQQAFKEKQEAQTSGNEKLASTTENKNALEAAFKEHFQTPMANSEVPNYSGLEPFLHQLEIEQSLLTALPGACAKDKSSRGHFDEVVLTEFEKAMNSKIASLSEIIETETPACVERERQTKCAESELNAKTEECKQASDALEASKKELAEREALVEKAKEAANEVERQLEVATALHDDTQKNLKWFEDGPLAEFLALKSKTAAPLEAATAGA